MTLITFSDGKVVMKGDAVGTEQACCCEQDCSNPSPGCCTEIISPIVADDFSLSCPDGFEGPNLFDANCYSFRCIDRCCDCGKGPFPTVLLDAGCATCDQFNEFTPAECGECPQCDEAP
jgi:hypothetical protein